MHILILLPVTKDEAGLQLVDFRRAGGDILAFNRLFREVQASLEDIILQRTPASRTGTPTTAHDDTIRKSAADSAPTPTPAPAAAAAPAALTAGGLKLQKSDSIRRSATTGGDTLLSPPGGSRGSASGGGSSQKVDKKERKNKKDKVVIRNNLTT